MMLRSCARKSSFINLMLERCASNVRDLKSIFLQALRLSTSRNSFEKTTPDLLEEMLRPEFVPHPILNLFVQNAIPTFPKAIFHKQMCLPCGTLKIQCLSKNDSKIIYMHRGTRCAGTVDMLLENPVTGVRYAIVNQFKSLHNSDLHIDPYREYSKHLTGQLYYPDSIMDMVIPTDSILAQAIYSPFQHSSGVYAHLIPASG